MRRPWFPNPRRMSKGSHGRRVVAIDAARGLAVVGMIFAHTGFVGVWGEDVSALIGISHGHSAILFAVVAGLSLGMISGGTAPSTGSLLTVRMRIVGRAAALLIISGALYMLPAQVGVILASYAFWFLLALPCLRWRPKTLIIAALLHAALGIAVADWLVGALSVAGIYVYNAPEDFVPSLLFSSQFPATVWMGFVFIGMAIARCGLSHTRSLIRFAVAGLVAFVVASAPFVLQERSLAPIFAGTDQPDYGNWPIEETALIELCLDIDSEELYPCTIADYEAQEVTFNDAQHDLYWQLYQQVPHGELVEWCLDVARTALYPCSAAELDKQLNMLTDRELQLYFQLAMELLGDTVIDYAGNYLYTLHPHSGSPFEAISSGGLAVFLVAGFLLLGRSRVVRILMAPLAAVGAMALTAYATHIAVMAYVPNEGSGNTYALWLTGAIIVGCALWRWLFVAGPLENFVAALADRFTTVGAGARQVQSSPRRVIPANAEPKSRR